MGHCYVHTGRQNGHYQPIWNRGGEWHPPTPAADGRAYLQDLRGLDLAGIAQAMRWPYGDAEADDLVQTIAIYLWWAGVELPADASTASTFIRAWARRRGFSNGRMKRWRRELAAGQSLLSYAMRTLSAPDKMQIRMDALEVVDTIASMTPVPEVFALLFIGELELKDAAPAIGLSPRSKSRIIETRDNMVRRVRNILHARQAKEQAQREERRR